MTVPGGLRPLLKGSLGGSHISLNGQGGGLNSQWPDSLPYYSASNETTYVWDRLWQNLASCPNAKTMTFCNWKGTGLPEDSVTVLGNPGDQTYRHGPSEGDLTVMRFGLAHFDSLIGGRLFTNGPAVRGIVVEGAVGRGVRRWMGGIQPADTSVFYSSLDSLAAWGTPVTFAANVNNDSATTYARDIIKLKSVRSARFTPYATTGVFDTSATSMGAGLGKTSNSRWVDPWGRWRRRVFVGDFNNWADTSVATAARRQIAACDSIFERPTVRVMCPPYDDWSPGAWGATTPYIAKANSRLYADSMMYALSRGGFIGVLANGQSDECNLSVSGGVGYTNPRGYIGTQGWYRPKFNGTTTDPTTGVVSYAGATMDPFMVLTHYGGAPNLGKTQRFTFGDTSFVTTSDGTFDFLPYTLDRANGFWTKRWLNADSWPLAASFFSPSYYSTWKNIAVLQDDFAFPNPKKSHVLRLFCSDLSGADHNPARTGLHVIRSLQQGMTATNLAAGRTLVRLGYLDEVRP
jgi:hypothetical protein